MTPRFGIRPIGPLGRGAGRGGLLVSTSMGLSLGSVRAGGGGGGTLINPPALVLSSFTTYPPPLQTDFDDTVIEGDVVRLQASEAFDFGTLVFDQTDTLDAAEIVSGELVFAGLGTITTPAQTFFRARIERGGSSSSWSNIVKHGDTAAPTITSATTQSGPEYAPMAYVVTANEPIERIELIGGVDAYLLEVVGTTIRLVNNANLNYNTKPQYKFNFRTYDHGGNFTDTSATFNTADEIPNAFTFIDDTGVSLSASHTSNTITLSGIGAGKPVPFTVVLGAGMTYTLNGTPGLSATSGTMQAGDTFSFQGTASADWSRAITSTLTIDGISDSYTIATMANPDAASLTFHRNGVLDYTYGSGSRGFTGQSIAVLSNGKLVVQLLCNFNGAAGDYTVTSVTLNGGAITLTPYSGNPIAQSGTNNANKTLLFYADAHGVSTITSMSVVTNGSTNRISYSLSSVSNAAAGEPNSAFSSHLETSATNPIDVDGGLAATVTGALAISAHVSTASKSFIWTGATEQSEVTEADWVVATAFQPSGQAANVTIEGHPNGVGFASLSYCTTLWEPA